MEQNTQIQKEEVFSEQVAVRREKLAELQNQGKNPYEITKFDFNAYSSEIKENYQEGEEREVVIAGRIMSRRIMGKASFCNLADEKGNIQLYIKRDDVGEEDYASFKKWDIGDIIGVEGFVFVTRTGEVSVHCKKVTLLSKSLIPLPEKFHGLTNMDMRYRQRYVDLIVNPEVKEVFKKRSAIL